MSSVAQTWQDFTPMYMSQQHPYYPAAPAPPRQYATHGTSSAFSSSANPDEDWTKISDLAERRRIQNRIAQRNYRKKLKRRLEDLERRAGTSDGSASPPGPENKSPPSTGNSKTTKKASPSATKAQKAAASAPQKPPQHHHIPQPQFTPPMHPDDNDLYLTGPYDDRERSHTPPQYLPYSTYPPPPEEMLMPSYGAAPTYQPMTTAEGYPNYLSTTVPCTLPSMSHFSDAMNKRDPYAPADESMQPYINYGYSMPQAIPYDHHSNPHTPPLSHSFDHSAACSESGYEYPTTPLSMQGSPGSENMLEPHHQ